MRLFGKLSYRNKLLVFMMSMVIFVAGTMGFLIRFIILPHLIREMERHAESAAARLSQNTHSYILSKDRVHLTAVLFDEKHLEKSIAYIIITDADNSLLAHTLIGDSPDPAILALAQGPPEAGTDGGLASSAWAGRGKISDIVVPVYEGLYKIGTIVVGIDHTYIDSAVHTMNLFHLGFTCFITGVSLLFCFYLSGVITRPITFLTKLAKEISFGKLNTCISVGTTMGSWDLEPCRNSAESRRYDAGSAPDSSGGRSCRDEEGCAGPEDHGRDEIELLAEAFNTMTRRLKASESELRMSEQNYRLLFNSNPNPVFVISRDMQSILDANDRASEIYGYSKEALRRMKFADLGLPDEDPGSLEAPTGPSEPPRPPALSQRIRHRAHGGRTFWVNVHVSHSEHMGIPALIATTTDISDIIEAETMLIQAGKMATLGEMAAGVAHELNQPLNAIKLGSEFLLTVTASEKPLARNHLVEVSNAISAEVDRASAIINHLREFGRKTSIHKERININRPLLGVFTIIGQQLKVHGIDVVTDLDEHLPLILSDENRIEQVLINLVNNARDAIQAKRDISPTAGPGRIEVRSFMENGRVTVTVKDNGCGIPHERRSRIFEPFFTTKPVGKGTGLGLSISFGIVRDYDGQIEFETKDGVGTTFKLGFPPA